MNKENEDNMEKIFLVKGGLTPKEVIWHLYNNVAVEKKTREEICQEMMLHKEHSGKSVSLEGRMMLPSIYSIDRIGEVEFGCMITPMYIDVHHYEENYGSVKKLITELQNKRLHDSVALPLQNECHMDTNPSLPISAVTKLLVIMASILMGHLTFALTTVVDGVTWNYWVTNESVVLEYPGTKTSTSRPNPVHFGTLPSTLVIPDNFGGYPVTNIGALAFQITDELDTIIVPESVKSIDNLAFVGQYLGRESVNNSYRYYKWGTINPYVKTFLFTGDNPRVGVQNQWASCSDLSTDNWIVEYGSGILQFSGCTCYVVQGTSGWGNKFFGGDVLYGAAKVGFTPENTIFESTVDVELSCVNNSAQIYYTLDGSEPSCSETANCRLYRNPLRLTGKTTIKALAHVASYPFTVSYTRTFAMGKAVTPSIVGSHGNPFYDSGNEISLSCATEDTIIHYTLDGTEPTSESLIYSRPFTISDTTTVKAKAFKAEWFESDTREVTFTRMWHTVNTPIISPTDLVFDNVAQPVIISCETEGATILYTTDGSDPTVNGREYKGEFSIYESCVIRAVARKYDWRDSEEATVILTRAEPLSEAVNLYGYLMETDTSNPWTVVTDVSHDGVSCTRSGAIGHGSMTWLQTSVRKAGTVSFWWKAACEETEEEDGETYWYDYGVFLVDGVEKAKIAGNDTGWRKVEVEIPSGGKHILRWEYRKDGATSYSPDCIWLDQVQWIPADDSGYTLTTPEPVPYSWLKGYNLGLDSDFETAAKSLNGKNTSGKAMSVWQDYVAGTDPTNVNSVFTAAIEMVDGLPHVTWSPNLNTNGEERVYTVFGKTNLTDAAWVCPTNAAHRFFRAKVEMP